MEKNKDEIFDKIMEEANATVSYEEKKVTIERHRIDAKLAEIEESKLIESKLSSFNFFEMSKKSLDKMDLEQSSYHLAAKNRLQCITPALTNFIPLHAGNLILLGATTGAGKSTSAANIAAEIVRDTTKRVLIFSGEEMANDVYNRITCLENNWNYSLFANFDEKQLATLSSRRRELAQQIVVLDPQNEIEGLTTTIEGLESTLSALNKNKEQKFDLVIIDYFQKINRSLSKPENDGYAILEKVTNILDKFKSVYPAPVVVFAQLKPFAKKTEESFEERLKQCRNLFVVATFAAEIATNYEAKTTDFTCRKARWGAENLRDKTVTVDYRNGRYFDQPPRIVPFPKASE